MLQKFRVLSGVDVDLYTTTVYEGWRGEKVDSKALSAEHIVTHQHICF